MLLCKWNITINHNRNVVFSLFLKRACDFIINLIASVWSSFLSLSSCGCCCRHRHLIKNQIALNSCIRFDINKTPTHTHTHTAHTQIEVHSYENSSSSSSSINNNNAHVMWKAYRLHTTHNYILRCKTGLTNKFLVGYSDGLSLGSVGLSWFNCLCRCLGVRVFVLVAVRVLHVCSLSFIWF